MTDEDKKKAEGVEAFLKRFKLVLQESDEKREDEAWTYDVDVYFDDEKIFTTKWGGGGYWDPGHVEEAGGTEILECMFGDAEAYASCVENIDDELDALDNFMEEFGYDKVKPAMNAFRGCRAMYEKLKAVVFFNCKWNDENDDSDGSVLDYLYDIVNYFNEQFENNVSQKLVKFAWEGDE